MALKIITNLIPLGHPNRPGKKLDKIAARIFHGTGNLNHGADADANRNYFARPYKVKLVDGVQKYFEVDGVTAFRYGATHVIIDENSATICIPFSEYAPGAGDRPNNYNNGFKGQTKIAKGVFNYRQNFMSIQIELCMNNMAAWSKVLENAIEFCKIMLPDPKLPNFRHFDVTGKDCPSPMSGPYKTVTWTKFTQDLTAGLTIIPNKPVIMFDGKELFVNAKIEGGVTRCDLRSLVESLGLQVYYDPTKLQIDIIRKK